VEPTLGILESLKMIWYAKYFAEGWRLWLINSSPRKHSKPLDYFITSNSYQCLIMNANNLLLYLHFLCLLPDSLRQNIPYALRQNIPYAPWLLGSQQCEHLFRTLRSKVGCYENFNTLTCFERINSLQHHINVIARNANSFFWRPHRKHKNCDQL